MHPQVNSADTKPLHERIIDAIQEAVGAYHRLTLVVEPTQSGKSQALRRIAEEYGWPLLTLSGKLAGALLEVPRRRRALATPEIVGDLIQASGSNGLVLDNAEILFEPSLAQDPLRLLQNLARSRSIVVAWPGTFSDDTLTYGEPGHPEERRYLRPQATVVSVRTIG